MGLDFDFSMLDAMDMLDLAVFVEEEAEDHYETLVSWMENQGNAEAARFFTKMAQLERVHRHKVAEQRQTLFADTPPRHTKNIAWEVEAPDYEALGGNVTLEQAYDIAVGAETRARDYYEGMIEYARDPKVVEIAEGLRDAEIEHLRMLRDWRAQAGV